jgi:hypothetical protein
MNKNQIISFILSLINLILQAISQSQEKNDDKVFFDLKSDMEYYKTKLTGSK